MTNPRGISASSDRRRASLDHHNAAGVPHRAVVGLGGLAAVGTLTTLVEAASLAFLFTFVVVCGLAFAARSGTRVVTGFGAVAGLGALVIRMVRTNPPSLAILACLVLVAAFGRPLLLRQVRTEGDGDRRP